MQGWDAFDGTQGEATLRVVWLTLDGKRVVHEDGAYYQDMSVAERLIVIGNLLTYKLARLNPHTNGAKPIQGMYPNANVLNWKQLGM